MDESDPLGLVGQVLDGKYAIERVAGIGGTAVVYRALHKTMGRAVAIKVVRILSGISTTGQGAVYDQLWQEASVLASLSERTSAILQARDVGMVEIAGGRVPYLVLEWLDGASLEDVLAAEQVGGLPLRSVADAMRLLEPVAQALAVAHRTGVAHRDIKPANVFVIGDPRGSDVTIKVLDFGIAKVVSAAQAADGAFRKTAVGGITSFTPAYGAPEQFSRALGATGPWTDVFALALVLAEVASGAPALRGDDIAELGAAATSSVLRPSLRRLGLAVSDDVEAVFARAVAVEIHARYASISEFWEELSVAVGHEVRGQGWPSVRELRAFADRPASGADLTPATTAAAPVILAQGPALSVGRDRRKTRLPLALAGAIGVLAAAGLFGYRHLRVASATASASSASYGPAQVPPPPAVPPRAPACPEDMVSVPAGKFFMGSDEAIALDFEKPAHQVTLNAFCIDRTEATVGAYKKCSDAGECKRATTTNEWTDISPRERTLYDPLCTGRDPVTHATYPVNCVDWTLADAFCRAQSKRLPTEAEWEFAARGPDGRVYPWGDEAPSGDFLNACGKECVLWGRRAGVQLDPMHGADDGWPTLAPVGSFPRGASRYGVEDVVGNVWEWVADWYGDYGSGAETLPQGPASGVERVIRGGGWNGSDPAWVRPTFRYKDRPDKRSHGIGFRCAAIPR